MIARLPTPEEAPDLWPPPPGLRDWFAGLALAGMHASMSSASSWPNGEGHERMALAAYAAADAMLAARAKTQGG